MNTDTIKFLIEKIEANPDFAKMLSDDELNKIESYKKKQNNAKQALSTMQKANMYTYRSHDNYMYWKKNKNQAYIIKNGNYDKYGTVNLSKADFDATVKRWCTTDSNDPFENIEWLSWSEYLYRTTKAVIGDLIDTVSPKERFFICWHPAYEIGYKETYGPYLSTIDMLRGVGVYAIMGYHEGENIEYFNKHYFKSVSELTDQQEIANIVKYDFNFFTKDHHEKFALCECTFKDDNIRIVSKSEVMTYEEHFKRLYGFLPVK